MQAGFARVCITPPLGTRMSGWQDRDRDHGCEFVRDDLYARALYLSHAGQAALIIGFDLLFFSRAEADRFKGAIGRVMNLAPAQILLNTSHTHAGPKVGEWAYDPPSDPYYLRQLEDAITSAALQARAAAVDVSVWAGATRTGVPMSRRRKLPNGGIAFAPEPSAPVCDALPVALLKDGNGAPVCLLFSVACHPSTISGFGISADYPGVAMAQLDAHLGKPASLFLQGAGGDTKAAVIAVGEHWRKATWDDVVAAGSSVASGVIGALDSGMAQIEPDLCVSSVEMRWPLQPAPTRAQMEAVLADASSDLTRRLWAQDMLGHLERGQALPVHVPITLHGLKLGRGLRVVGIEGEAVAELGLLMLEHYRDRGGVTFALGYTDGTQLYLPTSAMLDEGGYEVESFYEYHQPARLSPGMEANLVRGLQDLRAQGID
jgi:neutral ceramidase